MGRRQKNEEKARIFPWKIISCRQLLIAVLEKYELEEDPEKLAKIAELLKTTSQRVESVLNEETFLTIYEATKVGDALKIEHIWPIAITLYWQYLKEKDPRYKTWKRLYYQYSIFGIQLPDEERDWGDY